MELYNSMLVTIAINDNTACYLNIHRIGNCFPFWIWAHIKCWIYVQECNLETFKSFHAMRVCCAQLTYIISIWPVAFWLINLILWMKPFFHLFTMHALNTRLDTTWHDTHFNLKMQVRWFSMNFLTGFKTTQFPFSVNGTVLTGTIISTAILEFVTNNFTLIPSFCREKGWNNRWNALNYY